MKKERKRVSPPVSGEPSKVQQQFKDQVNINNIWARFQKTGLMPQRQRQPMFVDADINALDLATAEKLVIQAQTSFEALPAKIRRKFLNSPVNLAEFVMDPANAAEAEKLGITNPKPKVEEKPVEEPK